MSAENRIRSAAELFEEAFWPLAGAHPVISLVGGGGKSTLMETLAAAYQRKGLLVVMTTSTHIRKPDSYVEARNPAVLEERLRTERVVVVGSDAGDGKLRQSEVLTIADCRAAANVVIIEADGAKCLPCKVPRMGEPVLVPESNLVIAVLGIRALGQPLSKVCFRIDEAMRLLQCEAEHRLTEADLVTILTSPLGARKDVGSRRFWVVLNQCEDEVRRAAALRIADAVKRSGVERAICLSLRKGEWYE